MARFQRSKALLARLLLLAFGLAGGLLCAELAVRLLRPQAVLTVDDALYLRAPDGGFRLRPGYRGTVTNRTEFRHPVAVNADGLRGPATPATDGRLRLLAIGDSYTFGIGVAAEEAWPARLAVALGDAGRLAIALNAGVPGYGVHDAVDWLEMAGDAMAPDLVVLGVCLANDIQDAAPAARGVEIVYGHARRAGTRPGLGEWLYYRSHLFLLLKTAVPTGAYRRLRSAIGLGEPASLRNLRRELAVYRRPPSDQVAQSRAVIDDAVVRLARYGTSHGVAIAAFLVPTVAQLEPARFQQALAQLGVDPASYDLEAPARLFRQVFDAHGIPMLDLQQAFAAAGVVGYYPVDRHWTPEGHRLAARALARFLRQRGLVPAEPIVSP